MYITQVNATGVTTVTQEQLNTWWDDKIAAGEILRHWGLQPKVKIGNKNGNANHVKDTNEVVERFEQVLLGVPWILRSWVDKEHDHRVNDFSKIFIKE